MQAGRPRKSVEALKLQGTYRKDRHADRVERRPMAAGMIAHSDVGRTAFWMWEHVTSERPEWIDATDAAALWQLCELWELTCEARIELASDPKKRTAYLQYHAAFERLAGKFGLTPADRARLGTGTGRKEDDDLDRLLA